MSLTAANAVITIGQAILYPSPVQIQEFAADEVYDFERVRSVEVLMGVDGVLSAGFVWAERVQSITLQADSPSNAVFDNIAMQQEGTEDVYELYGTITLKSIATKFALIKGYLTDYPPSPSVKKILGPRRYQITWNRVIPAPM